VAHRTVFGEADFIIVNRSGEALVIEQKSGNLDETSDGLVKNYPDGRKSVAAQIHRTLDGIRDQFKRQSGREIALDYLIYCPDYRVRDLNAVGVVASRIVDAGEAARLAARIMIWAGPLLHYLSAPARHPPTCGSAHDSIGAQCGSAARRDRAGGDERSSSLPRQSGQGLACKIVPSSELETTGAWPSGRASQ
jgi:hypothetical protein